MSIKGEGLILSVHDGTAYRPVACLTSNSLSETRNVIESQTKCFPGVTTKTAGTLNYEISFEGEYVDTTSAGQTHTGKASHDYLRSFMDSGNEFDWQLATGLADEPFYWGQAVLTDLELTAEAGDSVSTFSGTMSGSGSIVTTNPNP